jgi:2-polyprenyl-6-methoxyphenol hydroxylase-like FAD-dependent oxidoreductase
VGNAAGEAHPIIGEGMSMALQGAFLLCAQLLSVSPATAGAADVQAGVAQRYASQWRQHFGARLRLAAVFAHMAMRPTTAAALLLATKRWPGLLGLGARWGGKLHSVADPRLLSPAPLPAAGFSNF